MSEYIETKEVEIRGRRFKIREFIVDDIVETDRFLSKVEEKNKGVEYMAFIISRCCVEPPMTIEEAKKLPIRVAAELQMKILEFSGFPNVITFGQKTTSDKMSLTFSNPIEVIQQEQSENQSS